MFLSWEKGEFDVLIKEARTIQSELPTGLKSKSTEYMAKPFAKHMLNGRQIQHCDFSKRLNLVVSYR